MKLHFLGGSGTVTGLKFLLEAKAGPKKNIKILVDCGAVQGSEKDEEENYGDFSFTPSEVDYLFVTHAHIDHIGLIPKLYREGFNGKIFATSPTIDLADLLLRDSQKIMERKVREGRRPVIFEEKDIVNAINLMTPVGYNRKKKLAGEVYFRFQDAGHILGSAIVEIWAEGKKIVFSGDLGNSPTPLLKAPAKIKEADYILIESTYGNRIHENKIKRKELLENTIEETFKSGGALMIPTFAVERTQELLFELNELVENNRIPRVPIFIDSPLAIKATRIYRKHQKFFNKEANQLIRTGDDLFNFPGLKLTESVEESKAINRISPPKIIIAGSGMSNGGRIIFHEKQHLPDKRSCLLIISFQAKGTLGREILEGAREISIFRENIPIKARVFSIQGYSSHADQKALYDWLSNFSKPVQKIFAVHGEREASEDLCQIVKDNLGIPCFVPEKGGVVDL